MAVQNPIITVNKIAAETSVAVAGEKLLIYGQKLASGNAVSGQLYQITSYSQAQILFGENSHILLQLSKVFDIAYLSGFKVGKPFPSIYAIALSDASAGVQATSVITLTGNATSAGIFKISINDYIKNTYSIDIANATTVANQAIAIAAVLNADVTCPVVASVGTGGDVNKITLTHKHKGLVGNDTYLEIPTPSTGTAVAYTAFAGGMTNPDLAAITTPIANIRFQSIVYPSCWNRDIITAFIKARWNVSGEIKDGILFVGSIAAVSSITSVVADNHPTICPFFTKLVSTATFKGSVHRTHPDVIPLVFATILALCVTTDSNLINFVPTSLTTGSPHYNAVPVFNSIISQTLILPVDPTLDITDEEEALLRSYCYSTFRNNRADNTLLTRPVVTTYKTYEGFDDIAFKYIEQVKSSSVCAEYIFENMQKAFAKTTITTGDPQIGTSQVTKDGIDAQLGIFIDDLTKPPYALIREGAVDDIMAKIKSDSKLDIKNGTYTTSVIGAMVMQFRSAVITFLTTVDYTKNEI